MKTDYGLFRGSQWGNLLAFIWGTKPQITTFVKYYFQLLAEYFLFCTLRGTSVSSKIKRSPSKEKSNSSNLLLIEWSCGHSRTSKLKTALKYRHQGGRADCLYYGKCLHYRGRDCLCYGFLTKSKWIAHQERFDSSHMGMRGTVGIANDNKLHLR